jgi:hypothetical protein
MFRALLAHPQDSLHERHLVYCGHVMSVGCTSIPVQATDITQCNIPIAVCVAPPEDEQVMLERCTGP